MECNQHMQDLSVSQWRELESSFWNQNHLGMQVNWKLNEQYNKLLRKRYFRIIESYLTKDGANILDLGCGDQWYFDHLNLSRSDVKVTGVDSDKVAISECTKKFLKTNPNFTYVCTDSITFLDQSIEIFDVIFCFASLHHMHEDDCAVFFNKVRAHLKQGGKLVIFEPLYFQDRPFIDRMIINLHRGMRFLQMATSGFARDKKKALLSPLERPLPFSSIRNWSKEHFVINSVEPVHYMALSFAIREFVSGRSKPSAFIWFLHLVDTLVMKSGIKFLSTRYWHTMFFVELSAN